MKSLILTEKPSVARDFLKALSSQKGGEVFKAENGFYVSERYYITWAIGHLLRPNDPEEYDSRYKSWKLQDLPILPNSFIYSPVSTTQAQLKIILGLLKKSDVTTFILATDAGREGELIGRLILEQAKFKKKCLRFFSSEALTENVVLKYLKQCQPLSDYDRLYEAGLARSMADWYVGMNLTRAATLIFGDLYSIGRVQTAVIGLLYQKKSRIEAFQKEKYLELEATFKLQNKNKTLSINALWQAPSEEKTKLLEPSMLQLRKVKLEELKNAVLNQDCSVKDFLSSKKSQGAPGLFSLTDLQRKANYLYGFSAQTTLDLAQELYEKDKLISYPRTESQVMGESSLALVSGIVQACKADFPEKFEKYDALKLSLSNKAVFDQTKLTDHHGLIPLRPFSFATDSPKAKIYLLILDQFIANFLKDFVFIEHVVSFSFKYISKTPLDHYISKGKSALEPMQEEAIFKVKSTEVIELGFKSLLHEKINSIALSEFKECQSAHCTKTQLLEKETKPEAHYTEASLLFDMSHPARLVQKAEHKALFRTSVGLGTQATRAQIIETLIKRNYLSRNKRILRLTDKGIYLAEQLNLLSKTKLLLSASETASWECELAKMNDGLIDKKLFLDKMQEFVSESIEEWKKVAPSIVRAPSKSLNQKASSYKFLKSAKCPLCQKEVLVTPKAYSCSGHKLGCSFVIWKTVASAKITEKVALKIIKERQSDFIEEFVSKKGHKFKAKLILDDGGKIQFQFS